MNIKPVLLLVCLFTYFSGFAEAAEPRYGYGEISIDNKDVMHKLEMALKKKGVNFYVFTEDNRKYIAYPKSLQNDVDKTLKEVLGIFTPYKKTKSLCSTTEKQQLNEAAILAKNNITHTTKNIIEGGKIMFCIYWPEKEDYHVVSTLPIYKAMKKACNNDPDCPK